MIMRFLKKSIFAKFILAACMVTVLAGLTISSWVSKPKDAEAAICCVGCCSCMDEIISDDISDWISNWLNINLHIFLNLWLHRLMWFDWEFWQQNMLPAFMNMSEQLAAVGTQQIMIIGTFLDAEEAMQTQRLLQELHAKAAKDYHPAAGMCDFGTQIKSLAATERRGEVNALIMSERSIDRLMGNTATAAGHGIASDLRFRVVQFQAQFCDIYDNGSGLDSMCPAHANPSTLSAAARERFNKDIDYARTFLKPWTLAVNLTDGTALTPQEEDVFSLASNLYGYETFTRPSITSVRNEGNTGINPAQKTLMKIRSVIAKTSVAENSFNSILALKSEGTTGSRAFFQAFLEQMGVPPGEILQLLGDNPSYHAQMEMLTKRIYQRSTFYTELYDKPANVERKGVAMQAIGLIQKFDLFKSYLRTEASLSVLLELSVVELQNEVEDMIKRLDVSIQ